MSGLNDYDVSRWQDESLLVVTHGARSCRITDKNDALSNALHAEHFSIIRD